MKIMILEILVQINLEQQMLNLQEVSVSAWGQLKIPFIYEKEDVLCCMCRTDEANQIAGPIFLLCSRSKVCDSFLCQMGCSSLINFGAFSL